MDDQARPNIPSSKEEQAIGADNQTLAARLLASSPRRPRASSGSLGDQAEAAGSKVHRPPRVGKNNLRQGGWDPASIGRGGMMAILLLTAIAAVVAIVTLHRVLRPSTETTISWSQTSGPSGGRINVLQINPHNPSIVYAGTDGGICDSHDGGATWQVRCTGHTVSALVIDPADPRILYMGTYAGVFRSVDSGATWSPVGRGLPRTMILSLALDPMNTSIVYAGTGSQVFKSTDGGGSWSAASQGLPERGIWALAADHLTPSVLYAGTDSGVFRSTDAGQQWQVANEGMPDSLRVQGLAVDPQLPSIIYAATDSGLYRSTDAAATWHLASPRIAEHAISTLAIDPNNTSILYAAVGAQGVWRSMDSGSSWQPTIRNLDEPVFTLAINPLNSSVLYAGTGRGVYYGSMATQSWQAQNQGLVNTNVRLLVGSPQSPDQLYASTGMDVYKTEDGGQNWFAVNWELVRPNILALVADPLSPDTLYAGTWYSEVYCSHDSGHSWHMLNGGLARDAPIGALAVWRPEATKDAESPKVLYAGTNGAGVFASSDGGIEWTVLNEGLDDLHVQVLTLAHTDEGTLYAGTNTGIYRLDLLGEVLHSNQPWQRASEGLPPDEVCSIVLDERSPDVIYAATVTGLGGIYRSADGGSSWATIGQGTLPTNVKVRTLALQSPDGKQSILYAGTDGGVFRSTDGGATWKVLNDGLPSRANVLSLWADGNSRLYASIQNNGVFTSTVQVPSPTPWLWIVALSFGTGVVAGTVFVGRWMLHSSERVQGQIFERNWPVWREHIGQALQTRNQVGFDALPNIPSRLRLRVLQQYVQEQGDDNLILRLNPPVLQPANSLRVWDLIRNWNAAQRRVTNAAAFSPVVTRIAEQLCQLLGFELLDSRSYKNLHGYVIKARALRLKMPATFPIVFLQNPDITKQDMGNLYSLMGIISTPSYLALLIVPDDKGAPGRQQGIVRTRLRILEHGTAYDLVVMSFDDLYRIFVAKDPEKRFIQLLLEQVDLTVVSPYVTAGPVPENMFFGRDYELKTVTRTIGDQNFAIVGGRKIGKTSILAKLYRSFTESPEHHALYLDCQAVQNYHDFCEATETRWKVTWSECFPEKWMQLVDSVGQQGAGQLIVILLDEVDALLTYDMSNQERLLKAFRAVAQEGRCRFVFCGGRILAAGLRDSDSALFNFCHVIRLTYLSPRDTGRIILEPMQEMGIGFEDASKLMQRIVDLTACHPNLVQYICQQLIVQLHARDDRFITLADLESIAGSTPFSEYFVQVMWGNTTPLERLITLLMLDQPSITVDEAGMLLRERGVEVSPSTTEQALEGLVLCSILNKEGQGYYFAAPAFPSIVTVTQDIEALLRRTMQDLGDRMPPGTQLHSQTSE